MNSDHIDLSRYTRDKNHFFDNACFIVEDTLFRVPAHPFEESPFFQELFNLSGASLDQSKNQRHRLENVKACDFRQLLRVVSPLRLGGESLTQSQWLSVLELATMWGLGEVRHRAIKELDKVDLDALEFVSWGRKYHVKRWWYRGLFLLSEREGLTSDELDRLGQDLGMKIISLQDHLSGFRYCQAQLSNRSNIRTVEVAHSSHTEGKIPPEVTHFIEKIFPDLAGLDDGGNLDDMSMSLRKQPRSRTMLFANLIAIALLLLVYSFRDV